jgi:sarcosine oxidase subunit alpha
MSDILLTVNGAQISVKPGATVAVAILMAGQLVFRRSVSGEPRWPLCGMGICYECRATVDGEIHVRTCQIMCSPGMQVTTA